MQTPGAACIRFRIGGDRLHRKWILTLSFLLLMGLLLAQSGSARDAAAAQLTLCATVLLPSLFPFSALANLFLLTGADRPASFLLRKPLQWLGLPEGAAAPMLMGLLGGYPLGLFVLGTACAQGTLSRRDASRVSRICNQAGPAFLLGAVGLSVFGSLQTGLLLWLVQLLSVLLTGLLFAAFSQAPEADAQRTLPQRIAAGTNLFQAIPAAISRSSGSMLTLCGSVVFFGTLCSLLGRLPLPETALSLLHGALELTGGVAALCLAPEGLRFVLASALLAWGGLCVHVQGLSALVDAGLPFRPYLHGKLVQTLVAAGIALLFQQFLRIS